MSPSIVFVLETWYAYVLALKQMGFKAREARHLASLKQRYQAGDVTEFSA